MEAELQDELRFHLEREIEENIVRGMTPEKARLAAFRSFGGVERVKEESRDVRGVRLWDEVCQDLRYGARMWLKQPSFTAIAIVTLALGIGANTAIFSVANTILLQPSPIKDADRIVEVYSYTPRDPMPRRFSYLDYLELRKRAGAAVDLFCFSGAELVLRTSGVGSNAAAESEAEELHSLLVTGTYFSTLGGNALLGRTLTPEDDQAAGAHPVAVLSHGFWQRRFGEAPDIVGRTILLKGQAFTVVGVAEASFRGVATEVPDVWLPLLMHDQLNPRDNRLTHSGTSLERVMGRLQPGVSLKQAEAALELAFSQLKQGRSGVEPDLQIKLYPVSLLSLEDRQMLTSVASVALGVVTLVMLIACLNVAGLALARMAARQREIAVRLSLGASRGRLLRQLFTESLLLAGAGGLVGLLLSRWVVQALSIRLDLREFAPRGVALDWRVMAYTLGISVFTAVVVGLLPAWQTTRFNLVPALKPEAAGFNLRATHFPLRSLLVVGQIALSLVLLLGAGLFARTLLHVTTIDPGFETKNLSVVGFRFRLLGYDETRAAQFQRELQERLVATPMVKDAVWVGHVPLDDDPFEYDTGNSVMYGTDGRMITVSPDGRIGIVNGGPGNFAASNVVSPNYFAALGIPLLSGRTFTEQETRDEAAVVVINEALQRRHWPGENPAGKSLWTEYGVREIIGVAKDTRNTLRNAAIEPYLYLPVPLKERLDLRLLVRSDAAPGALAATLRTTIRSLDPKMKINVRQFADMLKVIFGRFWVGTSLSSLIGVLALALAVMGLYGVTAFVVLQRTHEIGVRMALGARGADVVRLVLRQGLRLVIIGVTLGLLISAVATRVLAAALYGISPIDPLTFGVVTLLLGIVALLACYFPARRATKIDPMIALRCE